MRQLSELDASFLYLESETTPMHIGGIYVFDASEQTTPLAFSTFVAYLRSRLHVVPVFRQRLKEIPLRLGRPYWIDDPDFSIERHLAYVNLGEHGRRASLMTLASKILEEPLKRDRPLWHITFVDGFRLDDDESDRQGFALIVKLHHAAIDAFSGEDIIGKLLEYTPEPRPITPPRPWYPRPEPSEERVILQAGANILRTPLQFTSLAFNAAEATTRGLIQKQLRKLPMPFPLFSAPHSPFNRQITANRQIVSTSVDLSRLKAIKATLGDVTLNDVVLGLCAEALRRYSTEHGADTSRSLVAMTPISVRSNSLRRATGNQMSAMLLDLSTSESDPAQRIRKIHRNAVASEPYREAIAADRLTELLPSTMLALSARLYSELQIAQRYQPAFNLPITNVPGPQVPLYLQGARLIQQYNTAPLFDSMGLVIVAVSYQGRLTINFTLCPDVVAEGGSLEGYVTESLDAIEDAAQNPGFDGDLENDAESPHQTLTDDVLTALEGVLKKTLHRFRT
ncbi:wax ester/triacylglycerol synthase family O-acyltransferase [Marinobacter sp. M216]|uniref:diacylglycerol O-acyltransferase n=1 Tax=Marinobacter albus TaxID=3030833 RepID=A0ABT7HGM6_9GAMM|nr:MULTISPECIES: wax ester/triacylglycerol synthase family O-acyltransferase [unclassified Marinobacter]MBW7473079.1 wax ester/triacylglycerol synthase family O-acyltransferase [Marinobacter sp. F4218]MDK9559528.1 wax ester/triacylglycerol synthase family O-acyltransferase [Marinobacter sp. M216]